MTMRLAFSIAAAATPEILILDEVLAVGDAAFQAKCHARIEKIIRDGATVFFVSHSLAEVKRLCTRAIWLEKGRIAMDGPVAEVCSKFEDFSYLPYLPSDEIKNPRTDGTVPVFLFREKKDGRHFITARKQEAGRVCAELPNWAWSGIAFRAFAEPHPGTVALFRFCNKRTASHAYAVGDAEAAPYRASPSVWHEEDPVCQVSPEDGPGLVPVVRLASPKAPGFRFAAGEAERDSIIAADPSFAVSGAPFFVFPP